MTTAFASEDVAPDLVSPLTKVSSDKLNSVPPRRTDLSPEPHSITATAAEVEKSGENDCNSSINNNKTSNKDDEEDDDYDDEFGVLTVEKSSEIAAAAPRMFGVSRTRSGGLQRSDHSTFANAVSPVSANGNNATPPSRQIRRSFSLRKSSHGTAPTLPTVLERSHSMMVPSTAHATPTRCAPERMNSSQNICRRPPERTNSGSVRRLPPSRATSTDSALRAYRHELSRRSTSFNASGGGASNNGSSLRALRPDSVVNTTPRRPSRSGHMIDRTYSSNSMLSAITVDSTANDDWTLDSISLRKDQQMIADPIDLNSQHSQMIHNYYRHSNGNNTATTSGSSCVGIGGPINNSNAAYFDDAGSFACHDSISRYSADYKSTYSEHMPSEYTTQHSTIPSDMEISASSMELLRFASNYRPSAPSPSKSFGSLRRSDNGPKLVARNVQSLREHDLEEQRERLLQMRDRTMSKGGPDDLSFFEENSFSTLESGDLNDEGDDNDDDNDSVVKSGNLNTAVKVQLNVDESNDDDDDDESELFGQDDDKLHTETEDGDDDLDDSSAS